MSSILVCPYPSLQNKRIEVSMICCRSLAFLRSRSPTGSALAVRDGRTCIGIILRLPVAGLTLGGGSLRAAFARPVFRRSPLQDKKQPQRAPKKKQDIDPTH